ncbi:MAG: hypothetical protein QXU54_02160 [Candidatus Micrarchaeia archaeon]
MTASIGNSGGSSPPQGGMLGSDYAALEAEIGTAVAELERQEAAYRQSREKMEAVVAKCGKAMQLIHAGRAGDAERMLSEVRTELEGALEDCAQAGANADVALQEYVETSVLLAVMRGGPVPTREQLGVPSAPYILGLADVLGELRREIIEKMRKDDYATAVRLFGLMEGLYELLLPVRISNSIVPGLRRKLDVARSMVEQCRRDILMYKISKGL